MIAPDPSMRGPDELTQPIDLDANAAGSVVDAAWVAYAEAAGQIGNPSSSHAAGVRAAEVLTRSRQSLAEALGVAPAEIVFTSGGTEAGALAVLGVAAQNPGCHMVCSAIEHPAVAANMALAQHRHGVRVAWVRPNRAGVIPVTDVAAAIGGDTRLVSVMTASNETGVVQPVAEIGRLCRQRGVLFHTDAVQAAGRITLAPRLWQADLVSLSGHKIGAVPGIGALLVREGVTLSPLLSGGGQEEGRRAGTENVAGAASFAAAYATVCTAAHRQALARLEGLRDALVHRLSADLEAVEVVGAGQPRLCNTVCVRFLGCEGEAIMMALDIRGIRVSTGSACSTGALEPSPTLLAMGYSRAEAKEAVRFSLPLTAKEGQIDRVVAAVADIVRQLRAA